MFDDTQAPPPDDYEPGSSTASSSGSNVEQIAPHNLDAERIVLGAALQSPALYEHLARMVAPSDFYLPANEMIWEALATLAENDQPVEPVALLTQLREQRIITKTGGGPYLHQCMREATVPASADYYAHEVTQLARRRTALMALRIATQRLSSSAPTHEDDETMREAAAALNASVEAIANPNPTTTWSPVDLDAALEGKSLDPPPNMLIRSDGVPLFYEGGVHTISGESESGKTWVALFAVVQLITSSMDVVFIDFEDRAERVVGRLLAMGATIDQIRDHFHYIRPDRAVSSVAKHELAPVLEHAMLVILDGVTEAMTVHGFDLNSNSDASTFYELLPRWIADHGPAVCMIDHVVKDKEKQGRFALGAQHKLAGIDAAAYTVKVITEFGRGKKGMCRIDVAKDRPGHVREHASGNRIAEFTLDATNPAGTIATLDPPAESTTTDDGTWAPTVLMERISRYVEGNPHCSTRSIFDAVKGQDRRKREALELLTRRGHIATQPGMRNSTLHKVIRPFPDPDPDPDAPDPQDVF